MPRVTFITHDGQAHPVDAQAGLSLMRAAVDHGIPGIDGDCGGACACATCHVFIDPAWQAATGGRGEVEEQMLSFASGALPHSRLACQITVGDALDGLVVRMPDGQH